MGSISELQLLNQRLDQSVRDRDNRIKDLEQKVQSQEELIQELTSKLDKYQCIVHSPTISNGPRKQRAAGISAEPRTPRNLQDFDKDKDRFMTYAKSPR